MATETTALTKASQYAIIKAGDGLPEIMKENFGDEGMDLSSLDLIKIPAGGSTTWTVKTLEGEESVKAIEGVVVHWKDCRAYWEDSSGVDGSPPSCSSPDAKIGVGDPGGECKFCPFSKYKSHENERAQACKLMRHLYIIQPDSILPVIVSLPSMSLKPIKEFFQQLTQKTRFYYTVAVQLELEKQQSNGNTYAVVKPSVTEYLDDENQLFFKNLSATMKPQLERISVKPAKKA